MPDRKQELAGLEVAFAEAGGRGVELADRIDALRAEVEAYELGCEHARNAASWVIDGNTSRETIEAMVEDLEAGNPRVFDFLPRMPNLSGEFADDPTPDSLMRVIAGSDPDETIPDGWELRDALTNAYEEGVSETFQTECERILRAALED